MNWLFSLDWTPIVAGTSLGLALWQLLCVVGHPLPHPPSKRGFEIWLGCLRYGHHWTELQEPTGFTSMRSGKMVMRTVVHCARCGRRK